MLQSDFPEFDPTIAQQFGEGTVSLSSSPQFMGIPLIETDSLFLLLFRFGFNLLVSWILIQFFYYKKSRRRDYYFTFMLFSVTIFLLIFLLENVKMQMGFALGLFAIFGIIRYRTEGIPIREMTYLFIIIGVSVINGLALTVSWVELLLTNFIFIAITWVLESNKILKHTSSKLILYEKIQLVNANKEAELIQDLKERTGLNIIKVQVGHIDFLRDVAYIKVFYQPSDSEINTIDELTRSSQYSG